MRTRKPKVKAKRGQFANEYLDANPAQAVMRTRGEASISTERVTQSVRMRFNPLRGLTPERLAQYLDQFDLGFFRQAAITWDKIERRDPTLKSVAPKRKKAVARHGYDVLSMDKLEDSQRKMAEDQVQTLKYFYDNLTATNAIKPDEMGGLALLARQMMDAQGKYYACHEIVWQPLRGGNSSAGANLTAQFVFCPLWWFEGTTGKLRYMDSEFQVYGRDMLPGEWLVTCGEGLMEASSVAWMFKHLTMQDWLAYCEKFGTPFIDAATSASPGSEDWDKLVEYVQNFGPDGGGVRSNTATISPIELKGTGQAAYSQMVENMNRALTILWRGGDLGTTSAKDQTGASLQGDESDILEGDDAVLIEETLALHVSRYVISWKYGPDAPVLAYLRFKQEQDPDAIAFQRTVFTAFLADGTVCDVLANQTDFKKLTQDVGLPVQEDYDAPWLTVKDKSGAVETGEVLLDKEKSIVGGIAGPAPGQDPNSTEGNKANEDPNDDPKKAGQLANSLREGQSSAPSPALEEAGAEHYARALAHDLEIVREELEAISKVEDDRVFAQRAVAFKDRLDKLSRDILHLPKSAQALGETMIAALFTGLTTKPRAQLANGDVPGHEFHGNQWTEAASAEHRKLRAEADIAHSTVHQAEYGAGANAAHEELARLHQDAAEKYGRAAEHARQYPEAKATARLMRQKMRSHKEDASFHAREAKQT